MATERRVNPYEIDAHALKMAGEFVAGLNELRRRTGIHLAAEHGGIEMDLMLIGDLRWNGEEYVVDVRHA